MNAQLTYVTSSQFKKDENDIFANICRLSNGSLVSECFSFRYESQSIPERLEIDLEKLVREEVFEAYRNIQIPCFVEHAGLVVEDFRKELFPGGLTKAMWNALDDQFIVATGFAGKRAIARACVGYCDGKNIFTFVGDTQGILADAPRGDRKFYWDTVFLPEGDHRTYAEIVEQDGLPAKVESLSQSTKAKLQFLEHLLKDTGGGLW